MIYIYKIITALLSQLSDSLGEAEGCRVVMPCTAAAFSTGWATGTMLTGIWFKLAVLIMYSRWPWDVFTTICVELASLSVDTEIIAKVTLLGSVRSMFVESPFAGTVLASSEPSPLVRNTLC